MNIRHKASHVAVCGKSGMGKTGFALRFIRGSGHARVFIFDPESEFAQRMAALNKVGTTREELIILAEKSRIVIFDPGVMFPGQTAEAFAWFCDLVFELARDGFCPRGLGCLLVTDELQKYCNASFVPPEFRVILETGRRQMVDSISLSRAPNRLNTGIREEFTEIILFRLDDENSLKFAEMVGADTAKVRKLEEHEFLYFNIARGGERLGKLEFASP